MRWKVDNKVFGLYDSLSRNNILPDPTMATTIDVVVEELCSSTVANTPIIKSAMGLVNISLARNASPAVLPIYKI